MKKSFLSIAVLISSISFGQPVIKLYGFSQEYTMGIVRERDPSTSAPAKTAITHYLYTSTAKSVHIRPVEAWVKGQRFKIDGFETVTTPVRTLTNDLLISKTSQRVKEMKLGDGLPALKSTPAWLKKMIKENELVISYYWNGKKYYKALKKIKELETVFGE